MELDRYRLLLASRQFEMISTAATAGKSVHAYLIEGEPGTGKRSMARLLAAALLCRGDKKPCLCCNICRRVLEGNHPDVHVFSTDKRSISVDDMRALAAQSLESSYEDGARVFIVENADTMTVQAQNCLLKTLEEPNGSAVFVLVARSGELMLSTVRSRVRRVRMGGFAADDICTQLRALGVQNAREAADSCGGSIGRALEIAAGDKLALTAAQLLDCAAKGDRAGALVLLNAHKEDAAALLELTAAQLAAAIERAPQSNRLLKQLTAVTTAQARLRGNISFVLTADTLAAELT